MHACRQECLLSFLLLAWFPVDILVKGVHTQWTFSKVCTRNGHPKACTHNGTSKVCTHNGPLNSRCAHTTGVHTQWNCATMWTRCATNSAARRMPKSQADFLVSTSSKYPLTSYILHCLEGLHTRHLKGLHTRFLKGLHTRGTDK